jgi:glycosyltransferase involved in cell wall biosynthesis
MSLPEASLPPRVHVMGDFPGNTALSQVGRDVVEVLRHLGVAVEMLDLCLSPDRFSPDGKVVPGGDYQKPTAPLSVICWNGSIYPVMVRDLPRELFEGRRLVGIWFWETEELPADQAAGYDLVDEIWVSSGYIAEALAKTSPVPVRRMPHLIRPLTPPATLQLPPELRNDRFLFYFSFDYRSVSRRKNPGAVCEAFVQAFPETTEGGPLCVIKSVAGRSRHRLEFLKLKAAYRHRSDIFFLDGFVPVAERDSLMARADCYVSLHRSEGLGLTLMEAMTLGKPCIATDYSGNLDFMTGENSWLVRYDPVAVGPGASPYPPEHLWAEPDVDAAAAAMREVVARPDLVRQKGEAARRTIEQNHGIAAVSARMAELLAGIDRVPIREKPALAESAAGAGALYTDAPTGRALAYEALREASDREKAARERMKGFNPKRVDPEIAACLKDLLESVKLQRKAHSEILREIGEMKKRLYGTPFDLALENLTRDNQEVTAILSELVDKQA